MDITVQKIAAALKQAYPGHPAKCNPIEQELTQAWYVQWVTDCRFVGLAIVKTNGELKEFLVACGAEQPSLPPGAGYI